MNKWVIIILVGLAVVAGVVIGTALPKGGAMAAADDESVTDWTCSMHPQVSLPEAGACPICGMDLIPRSQTQASPSGNTMELNEHAKALAKVETASVIRGEAIKQMQLSARIVEDPTRVRAVTVLGSGRLEQLHANYIGMPVKKGDHLAEIFSPEFSTAAAELLAASQSQPDDSLMVKSAKRKLTLLGVSPQQIDAMLRNGEVPPTYTLYCPIDGIISTSHGHEGEWFKKDQKLFEIVNLETVWLHIDAYESQLEMVYFGQPVTLTMPSFPGRSWKSTVSFIQPILNAKSRSVQVRATIENSDGVLRPNMFAYARVEAHLDAKSRVIQPSLKGKWISPMHPEIVRDEPGQCPICGMDLVSGEEFIKQQEASADQALLIPDTAPLVLGERAVVYVAVGESTYEPRLVKLGHHVQDAYVVLSGLKEGEQVVKRGAFRIDSDLQIQAKPSMMTMWPHDEVAATALSPDMIEHIKPQLLELVDSWMQVQEKLSKGETGHLLHVFQAMEQQFKNLPHRSDIPMMEAAWQDLQKLIKGIQAHPDNLKEGFEAGLLANISEALIKVFKRNDIEMPETWAVMYCPMVPRGQEEGAYWLQKDGEVENPFFLGGMRHCGEAKAFSDE